MTRIVEGHHGGGFFNSHPKGPKAFMVMVFP